VILMYVLTRADVDIRARERRLSLMFVVNFAKKKGIVR